MQHHTATLKFASTQLNFPIPTTVFYNLSKDNALETPYALQDRLPRNNLQLVFTQLNVAQRKDLTRNICKLVLNMQSLAIPPDPDNDGKVHSLLVKEMSDTLTFISTTC